MRFLLVGDMHVQRSNLEESGRLTDWVNTMCAELDALPVFMGDQYNYFGIAHVEVIDFWQNAYNSFPAGSVSLVGNHDLNADSSASAMCAHDHQTGVIGSRYVKLAGNHQVYAVGYIRDNELFTKTCLEAYTAGARVILCHAEFNGAQFENGFYSPHGVELSKFPKDLLFISGHIHKRQIIGGGEFARVFYLGTPRMLTRSDIGEIKGVTLLEAEGTSVHLEFHETPVTVAEPFKQVTITEGQPLPDVPNSPKVYVDIVGSPEFVKKQADKMPELAHVRTLPKTDAAPSEVKESEGIPVAFGKFANKYFQDRQVSKEVADIAIAEVLRRCPMLKGASNG